MINMDGLRRFIQKRRTAYRAVFTGPAADIVLADLRKFCRADRAPAMASQITGTIDPIATGIAIGRQEVWHRIAQNVHISDEDLYRLVNATQEGDQDVY